MGGLEERNKGSHVYFNSENFDKDILLVTRISNCKDAKKGKYFKLYPTFVSLTWFHAEFIYSRTGRNK